jgi:hypothetical protein
MPYKYKKVGNKYAVYKKSNGKLVGKTKGTKEALRKYLSALYITILNTTPVTGNLNINPSASGTNNAAISSTVQNAILVGLSKYLSITFLSYIIPLTLF